MTAKTVAKCQATTHEFTGASGMITQRTQAPAISGPSEVSVVIAFENSSRKVCAEFHHPFHTGDIFLNQTATSFIMIKMSCVVSGQKEPKVQMSPGEMYQVQATHKKSSLFSLRPLFLIIKLGFRV